MLRNEAMVKTSENLSSCLLQSAQEKRGKTRVFENAAVLNAKHQSLLRAAVVLIVVSANTLNGISSFKAA